MGVGDDMKNAAEKMGGKVKEGVGKVTGNDDLENEGRLDQTKAAAKQAGQDVKDVAEKAGDNVRDAFDK